jgi:hypothetical protein
MLTVHRIALAQLLCFLASDLEEPAPAPAPGPSRCPDCAEPMADGLCIPCWTAETTNRADWSRRSPGGP